MPRPALRLTDRLGADAVQGGLCSWLVRENRHRQPPAVRGFCRRAKVGRFVFFSVIHPVLNGLPNPAQKASVEEAALNSDLRIALCIRRRQNYTGAWSGIVKTAVIAEPWSNDTWLSSVEVRSTGGGRSPAASTAP
jgi:hypothetical protein